MILTEGDKSNNKFYVVLSGEVSILIRNSENVFISENLQRKFMKKMNKERLSVQVPATPTIDSLELSKTLHTDTCLKLEPSPTESPTKDEIHEKIVYKKTKTVIGIKTSTKQKTNIKKKHSLIPSILSSQTLKAPNINVMGEIDEEEDNFIPKQLRETPQVPILPFFHLGKEIVLGKLKEMWYRNKNLYKG